MDDGAGLVHLISERAIDSSNSLATRLDTKDGTIRFLPAGPKPVHQSGWQTEQRFPAALPLETRVDTGSRMSDLSTWSCLRPYRGLLVHNVLRCRCVAASCQAWITEYRCRRVTPPSGNSDLRKTESRSRLTQKVISVRRPIGAVQVRITTVRFRAEMSRPHNRRAEATALASFRRARFGHRRRTG